ncbi:ABC transporter family substrate-binding protein [Antrihabitans stalactiti]|uniref:ABC transporter family substrate-binding protein n=1 Tax=Antrihabitans stalactiti TaxID=2584121 RepID=A0A848KLB4_9NOCA|nr:ABC transporter family substrate-binding protein [Antrihabitans stalactiti]NMN98626.1 ABC transporter family substrate-binding protein [Antrihabitans stalactiti]
MRLRTVAVPLVALGLVLSSCSSDTVAPVGPSSFGSIDINPKDPSELADGGNLRLSLASFPANFNRLSNDGNDHDVTSVITPTLPSAYFANPDGTLTLNTDYFTSIELTSKDPQVVTYTINPKAVWTDGSPITWEDLQSQAEAMSGRNKEFLIAGNSGFDRVAKVEKGVDDRQAVLTFSEHFADWKGQYLPLYPKSATATPEAFNTGLLDNLPISSGPFKIDSIDKGQQRVVLARNPLWWGAKPKLDKITFIALADDAVLPALQNNEIDASDDLVTIDQLKTAQSARNVVIRRAPNLIFSHITFNGASGSVLADPKLRLAIAKAIDRKGIATAIENGLTDNPAPLDNHIYLNGQEGYQDNSSPIRFDPDKAAQELDDLGWKLVDGVRQKDGKVLEIRDVFYNTDKWTKIGQIVQNNLSAVGVKVVLQPQPGNNYFTDVVQPGHFDIVQFSWVGNVFPFDGLKQIYSYDPDDLQGNYGRIGSPELNDLIDRTYSELDEAKARELANEVDRKVFEEGFSLPLYQWSGNRAVRDNVANYGAFGLTWPFIDYTKIGFVK